MKKRYFLKLKNGMTLVELTVAMALSTIVVGGSLALMLLIGNNLKTETENYEIISNANNLISAIDVRVNSESGITDYTIANDIDGYIFSTESNAYYFSNGVFGTKENASSDFKEIVYTSEFDISLNTKINSSSNSNLIDFVVSYGEELSNKLTLTKKIG